MALAAPVAPELLLEGDRLSTEEFLDRWEAMPDLKHAELFEGTVFMALPVGLNHCRFQSVLTTIAGMYCVGTPGCMPGSEGTWLMGSSVPQPDVSLEILPQ